uniref:Uncharacterized protein n=1 Tax=Vibrio tasmaniensis TaxID=212663 RepID=A0A0H3ZWR2_9VIBR|nr:hypothetical protein [Vibrio tasmaniensis]
MADARRSVQNILNPNRVQEYLKCLRDIAIMKGLTDCEIVSTPKKATWQGGFFTSGE